MQVLLLKDVEGVGHAGDIKHVAGGYASNFLFPRNLAMPASEGALKQAKTIREATERRQQRKSDEAKELADRLDGQVVVFKAKAGEGDRLYGSITGHDVAEALAKVAGTEVDHRFLVLEHPIKTLGEHEVPVKVASGAIAKIRVRVERQDEEEQPAS
jgi:large subunit ribosomal protein L9